MTPTALLRISVTGQSFDLKFMKMNQEDLSQYELSLPQIKRDNKCFNMVANNFSGTFLQKPAFGYESRTENSKQFTKLISATIRFCRIYGIELTKTRMEAVNQETFATATI